MSTDGAPSSEVVSGPVEELVVLDQVDVTQQVEVDTGDRSVPGLQTEVIGDRIHHLIDGKWLMGPLANK